MKPVVLETPLKRNNGQVVELLREMLELAERGELEAIAIVGLLPDGVCRYRYSQSERFATLVGGVEVLKHQLIAASI